jgi:hypothetical protein
LILAIQADTLFIVPETFTFGSMLFRVEIAKHLDICKDEMEDEKMKKWMAMILIALMTTGLGLLAACGGDEDDDEAKDYGGDGLCDACMDAAPEGDAFAITIPGADGAAIYASSKGAVGEMAEYYHLTVDISEGLNFYMLGTLGFIDEILSYPHSSNEDEYCVWGPFIYDGLDPVETQFRMRRSESVTGGFDYYWEQRPKNTTVDFTAIWGGEIIPSTDTARRGTGNLYIDYTAAQALDPTFNATGLISVEYDTYTDGRLIDIEFDQVAFADGFGSNDYGVPTDAEYHYHNRADNSGEFTFVYQADLEETGGTALESIVQTTLWKPEPNLGAGGSTFEVTGGDLAADGFDKIVGYECWDSLFKRTYFELVAYETGGGTIDIEEAQGVETDCVFDRADYGDF